MDNTIEFTKSNPENELVESLWVKRVDEKLRNPENKFAKLTKPLYPKKGEEYLNSEIKRMLDIMV